MRIERATFYAGDQVRIGDLFLITVRSYRAHGVAVTITNLRSGHDCADLYHTDRLHRIGVDVAFKCGAPYGVHRMDRAHIEWHLGEQYTYNIIRGTRHG